jgi:uncharacterized protein YjbI with pentapeptide repeats
MNSVALSGAQWRSVVLSGTQWRSVVLSGTQWCSVALSGAQSDQVCTQENADEASQHARFHNAPGKSSLVMKSSDLI